MKQIGLKAYRLSISWPRVLPDGIGRVNPKGLDFYDRLINALLSAHIEPYITLFHWDFPYELYCRGGWLNRDSSDWFAEYVTCIAAKLSDRVRHCMTLNEPQVFLGLGHMSGRHAPGEHFALAEALRAAHNVLLAHGKAVQPIRAASTAKQQIGWAPVGHTKIPATDSPADMGAARQAMFSITARDCWNNTWFMDPVILGQYPQDGLDLFGSDAPKVRDADMETICQPLDFLGLNIYQGQRVRAGRDGRPQALALPDGHPITAFRWPVTPEALYWGPKLFYERYRLPLVITENGMSNIAWVSTDGKVHDPQRIDYLRRHLLQLRRAIQDGVDVRGYFCWSVLDNFEWAEGFRERFGLIYVDYPTQERILKDSAHWYSRVIASNGIALD
jgi:beta-glucosidase